jgi:nitroimidazol reductase NimA-like FMN-containing flavoprotein (pyridoxamine 5'-phosphate oxidase superfamily)
MTSRSEQRRGRRIMMDRQERDAFLAEQRTCRVATVSADGSPHATPLWFYWDPAGEDDGEGEGALWLYSLTRSQRWADTVREPRVAVVVDAGHEYGELRGVEVRGSAEPAEAPPAVRKGFARKNFGLDEVPPDGRHDWLRITPTAIRSWDFRKIPQG